MSSSQSVQQLILPDTVTKTVGTNLTPSFHTMSTSANLCPPSHYLQSRAPSGLHFITLVQFPLLWMPAWMKVTSTSSWVVFRLFQHNRRHSRSFGTCKPKRGFPEVQWLGVSTSTALARVQSLVWELRFCKPATQPLHPLPPTSSSTKCKFTSALRTCPIWHHFLLPHSFHCPLLSTLCQLHWSLFKI